VVIDTVSPLGVFKGGASAPLRRIVVKIGLKLLKENFSVIYNLGPPPKLKIFTVVP
jgi:hypothetical protein